jgi:hypothetical protein
MRHILAFVLLFLFAGCVHASCPDVEKQFFAYRAALLSGSDIAQFFSRDYLEDLVNGLKTDDQGVLLH